MVRPLPLAVLDVGSNSIRLVVFAERHRLTHRLIDESVDCGLGRGLASTGHLATAGKEQALAALRRFALLVHGLGVRQVVALATAAIRMASDGPAFLQQVRRATGLRLTVIDGPREARLAAAGVAFGLGNGRGMVGDLGGGSLELVAVRGRHIGQRSSLALGPFAVSATTDLAASLAPLRFWPMLRGQQFVAVGGAWRALGRLHQRQQNYPLPLLHGYCVPAAEMTAFCRRVAAMKPSALQRYGNSIAKRADVLPHAARLLATIIQLGQPAEIVFSSCGLREGVLAEHLPASAWRVAPLLVFARQQQAERGGPAPRQLVPWLTRIMPRQGWPLHLLPAAAYLARAGFLADTAGAVQALLEKILLAPELALPHAERAWLVLVLQQATGHNDRMWPFATSRLLPPAVQAHAVTLGLSLRLANSLDSGTDTVLAHCPLVARGRFLTLRLGGAYHCLATALVNKRLGQLAAHLRRRPRLVTEQGSVLPGP